MKQRIFTLLMMFALMVVAGSAKAEAVPGRNDYPYQGGEYRYSLDGIGLSAAGNAQITTTGTGWTINDVNHTPSSDNVGYTLGSNIAYALGPAQTLAFDIAFNDAATTGVLTVTVTQGTCSNFIEFTITPQARPTIALKIEVTTPVDPTTVADPLCLAKKISPLTNNTDAVKDGDPHTNTVVFTVTPTIANTNGNTFDYSYSITISDLTSIFGNYTVPVTLSKSGTGVTATTTDTYQVTFDTEANVGAQTITGEITSGSLTVTTTSGSVSGNVTYGTANVDKTAVVYIGNMPAIGTFAIN